jgi:hypothetical protein
MRLTDAIKDRIDAYFDSVDPDVITEMFNTGKEKSFTVQELKVKYADFRVKNDIHFDEAEMEAVTAFLKFILEDDVVKTVDSPELTVIKKVVSQMDYSNGIYEIYVNCGFDPNDPKEVFELQRCAQWWFSFNSKLWTKGKYQ